MEQTIRIDDLDGSTDDVQTVTFALGKTHWEIDLSARNRDRLAEALSPFTEHARKARKTPHKRASNAEQKTRKAIREWARENDLEVSENGKLPTHIIEAYTAAQSDA